MPTLMQDMRKLMVNQIMGFVVPDFQKTYCAMCKAFATQTFWVFQQALLRRKQGQLKKGSGEERGTQKLQM